MSHLLESRRSNLIFVGCQGSGGPVQLDRLRRVLGGLVLRGKRPLGHGSDEV
jgi:hypothetical protein